MLFKQEFGLTKSCMIQSQLVGMEEVCLNYYSPLEQIGSGSFAKVYRAMETTTHQIVSLKVIDKTKIEKEEELRYIESEIEIMRKVDHPYIIHLFENIDTPTEMYIIMEYVPNGSLLELINKSRMIPEPIACRYFAQMVDAMDYLHNEMKIVHRDLKAENILIDHSNNIRIIDFGLSKSFSNYQPMLETCCGSPAYAAPEMILGRKYDSAVDVWSIGILLFGMCVGYLPFNETNISRQLQQIITVDPVFPTHLSPALTDLLKKMLTKDPLQRITIPEIKMHPWFTQNMTLPVYRSRLVDPNYIDENIIEGISWCDRELLRKELLDNCYSHNTALYKMLILNKMITHGSMSRRSHSPHSPTSGGHRRGKEASIRSLAYAKENHNTRSSPTNVVTPTFICPSRVPALSGNNSPLIYVPKIKKRSRALSMGGNYQPPTISFENSPSIIAQKAE